MVNQLYRTEKISLTIEGNSKILSFYHLFLLLQGLFLWLLFQRKMTILIFINNPPKASASFHIGGILFNLYQFGFPLLYHKQCQADLLSPQEYPGAFDGGFELLHADRH